MDKIPSLERLVEELSRLPGIGSKTAQRLSYYILRSSREYSESLREALKLVKERVRYCDQCFSFTEEPALCHLCSDSHRRNDVICVVEDPSDVWRIESSGVFKGRYHVLHGAIAPLDGVSPKDLKIDQLIARLDGSITEVIFALDADLEGDTTVLYLSRLLHERSVKVSRIAHGVPFGSDIDYIDHRTLGRALENRIEV
jgi:recombination protein RecR